MFVDVTIACGGKCYSAHKFVLSTCSEYFKQIFTHNSGSNPILFMKDVSSRDIEALLDFMYHGEVNVPQSSLGSLIKTAESLQIKGLAVPDDPPSSKKEQERDKRSRESSSFPHSQPISPPPKRRPRNFSPPHRNLTSLGSQNNTSVNSDSKVNRNSINSHDRTSRVNNSVDSQVESPPPPVENKESAEEHSRDSHQEDERGPEEGNNDAPMSPPNTKPTISVLNQLSKQEVVSPLLCNLTLLDI